MQNQGFSKIRLRLISLKIPILILLTGILLISILSWEARKDALEQLRQQFIIDAATRASIIHDTLEEHLIDLEGLRSFYNASTSVTPKDRPRKFESQIYRGWPICECAFNGPRIGHRLAVGFRFRLGLSRGQRTSTKKSKKRRILGSSSMLRVRRNSYPTHAHGSARPKYNRR